MSTAIATTNQATQSRALIQASTLQEMAEQRSLLGQYVRTQMKLGTDYGVIPGTENKTLLKPGAEKLTDLFRCTAEYELTTRTEQWEDPAFFYYLFSCRIVFRDTGAVVAHGVGSCSSRESRYRWRKAARTCPSCGAAAIIKGKSEYGGGWLCFKKNGGCGAKFADNATEITSQPVGRVENPDAADVANTVLKMAKKRALVDAAIALARCSDLFTQDVGDDDGGDHYDAPPPAADQPARPAQSQQSPPQQQPTEPTTGPELLEMLREWDARTAGRGRIAPGALLQHIQDVGFDRGLAANVAEWPADAIGWGVAEARSFFKGLRKS